METETKKCKICGSADLKHGLLCPECLSKYNSDRHHDYAMRKFRAATFQKWVKYSIDNDLRGIIKRNGWGASAK